MKVNSQKSVLCPQYLCSSCQRLLLLLLQLFLKELDVVLRRAGSLSCQLTRHRRPEDGRTQQGRRVIRHLQQINQGQLLLTV